MKLKESVKGALGIILFYLVIIVGMFLLSSQSDMNTKSVDAETPTQYANVNLNS